jgi:hypothetical protein
MKEYRQKIFTGERAQYHVNNVTYYDSTFEDGESPLKECHDIVIHNSFFKWKYPVWYSKNIQIYNSSFLETARSGLWYSENIYIKDSIIEAPKQFRRSKNITLENTNITLAEETLWSCENIKLTDVFVRGDYFGMNSKNIEVKNFTISGNYIFDGGSNITIDNAKLNSKDALWNCENVVVSNSTIIGEYLGWNSKNLTFINCTIESNQGLCYIEGLKLINCKLINTNLCFELCKDIDAEITSKIDSVKNPINGIISAESIGEIILDDEMIDKTKTKIITKD